MAASALLTRWVDWSLKYRRGLLTLGLVATALAWYPASQLQFDQSIESLYAHDNPRLRDFLQSRELFGGDEFALVCYRDPDLFTEAGQDRLRALSTRLSELPGVRPESTQDLSGALAVSRFPFLASRREQILDMFRGFLLGDDNQTTAVVLRLQPAGEAALPRSQTIRNIRQVAESHQPPGFVVGEPVQIHDMFRYVEDDGSTLGIASTGLLVIVILCLFRSVRWVVLPILVVQATLIWTRCVLVLSRLQLSMVSSMLNSLVTVIGVATIIHIAVHTLQRRDADRATVLRDVLCMLYPAFFWTCATTAAGFAAQLSSHIHPVQSFGAMMALGSMLVLVAVAVFVPGGALLGVASGVSPGPSEGPRMNRALVTLTNWIERHPSRMSWAVLAVLGFSICGFGFLRVETDFSKNFRSSSSIVQALDFVETHLGGAGSWEVHFAAPSELSPEFLAEVRDFATELRALRVGNQPALTKVLALSDGADLIPEVPIIASTLGRRLQILRAFQPEFESSMYNAKRGRMRIMLRARERQPSEDKLAAIQAVEQLAERRFAISSPDDAPRVTGLFVLLTFLIESLLGDQWVSFLLAGVGILLMMTLAYRSWQVGLISLVPNVLPIVIVIGVMGWAGLPINIATAMIASVSMGLTVDSSIHYLTGFSNARAAGMPFYQALRETHTGVGRSLVYANLALVAGFLVLSLSHFIPLVYFGILVSVAMLGGLMGNLVLLPLLLRLTSWSREPADERLARDRPPPSAAPDSDGAGIAVAAAVSVMPEGTPGGASVPANRGSSDRH